MQFLDKSIQEIHDALKKKEISPKDLVEEAFERIEKSKNLNAYITLNKEEALKQAEALEQKDAGDNLLFGLPIAVKDNILTKGLRTTCASHILDNFIPIYDATIVEKIKANEKMSTGLEKLMAVAENYPDLKANTNFQQLNSNLTKVEEDIANARKYYNGSVRIYNDTVKMFPSNIIAGMFHYQAKPMFEVNEQERENVKVEF